MKSDIAKSGLENDVVYARHVHCHTCNNPDKVKFAKKAMIRRMRRLAKQEIAEGLDEHIKRYDEDHEDIYNLREEEGLLDLTSNDIMESLSK